MSSCSLNVTRDGNSTTSPGNFFQNLATFSFKIFPYIWNFLCFNLCPWPLLLSLCLSVKNLAQPSLHLTSRSVKTAISSTETVSFPGWTSLSPSASSHCWVLQPLTILVASTAFIPVCQSLSCMGEPRTEQSSPDVVPQVLKKGKGSLASTWWLIVLLIQPSVWLAFIQYS